MEEDSDLEFERALKRRKGGLQQRLKPQKDRAAASTPKDSALAAHLEIAWAWGNMSPQQVQQIAALAEKDMVDNGCSTVPEKGCLNWLLLEAMAITATIVTEI